MRKEGGERGCLGVHGDAGEEGGEGVFIRRWLKGRRCQLCRAWGRLGFQGCELGEVSMEYGGIGLDEGEKRKEKANMCKFGHIL